MPYKSNSELSEMVRENLPEHGQDIYREAFNISWDEYKEPSKRRGDASREETAHKVAWSAVKKVCEKDSSGNWVKKIEILIFDVLHVYFLIFFQCFLCQILGLLEGSCGSA
jgi:cation transport regulator